MSSVLDGEIVVIDGELSLQHRMDGALSLKNLIDGEIDKVIRYREEEYYRGEIAFTPSPIAQTVSCKGFTMPEDITINPIPSNYGLITYNGSILMVS